MTAAAAVATISVLVTLPFSLNSIISLALKRLLDSFKHLQIIVHIMLIDVFTVAHCEVFIGYVLQISNLQLLDLSEPMVENLPVNENEAINLHFEKSGYEIRLRLNSEHGLSLSHNRGGTILGSNDTCNEIPMLLSEDERLCQASARLDVVQ